MTAQSRFAAPLACARRSWRATTLRLGVAAAAALGLGVLALSPAPAAAQSVLEGLDRETLREEIRAFLLEEPEIVAEALRELERRRIARAIDQLDALVAAGEVVTENGPPAGEADLTLIEFTDYNCPYCRRAQPEIAAFLEADPGIRHVVKALPYIGADTAERATLAAAAQGDPEKVAALHQAYMSTQSRLTDDMVIDIAAAQGFDIDRLIVDMSSPAVEERMARTVQVARALQIDGTPAFIFEGQVLGGLRSSADFQSIATVLRAERAN